MGFENFMDKGSNEIGNDAYRNIILNCKPEDKGTWKEKLKVFEEQQEWQYAALRLMQEPSRSDATKGS